MDTLVVYAADKKPMSFRRKFISFDENNLLIAGTGHADFINGWLDYCSSYYKNENIDQINRTAPNVLYHSVNATGGLSYSTATLYHFGYSEEKSQYIGYAYRSENDFKSEKLQYGLGIKPVVQIESTNCIQFPDFLIKIIHEQQKYDKKQPITHQVGIGGEIDYAVLKDGKVSIKTVDRFESYEKERKYIELNKRA